MTHAEAVAKALREIGDLMDANDSFPTLSDLKAAFAALDRACPGWWERLGYVPHAGTWISPEEQDRISKDGP